MSRELQRAPAGAALGAFRPRQGHHENAEIVMVDVTRRRILGAAVDAASVLTVEAARRASFGDPDEPPQGALNAKNNTTGLTDPCPHSPSFAIVAFGFHATHALILSQAVLSLILLVPMTALLVLTRRPDVMGSHASGVTTATAATTAAAIVLGLNLLSVLQIAGVPLPALSLAAN